MTAVNKVHQAVVDLRSNSRNLQSLAMETGDQEAQQMCTDFSKQLNQMASDLTTRIKAIENEHPQIDVPDHEYTYW